MTLKTRADVRTLIGHLPGRSAGPDAASS